jgi:putative acetyltransferase
MGNPGMRVGPPEGFAVRQATDSDAGGVIGLYAACWGEHVGMVLDTVGEMAHLNYVASHYARVGGLAWVAERGAIDGAERGAIDGAERVAIGGAERRAIDGAERGASIAGSVAWRPVADDHAELQMLYVMPDARRNGLASHLVVRVEQRVADLGFGMLELWSDIRFPDAHRLYRALGWEQLEETRHVDDLSDSTEFHFLKPLR